jgi:hypothetical protein
MKNIQDKEISTDENSEKVEFANKRKELIDFLCDCEDETFINSCYYTMLLAKKHKKLKQKISDEKPLVDNQSMMNKNREGEYPILSKFDFINYEITNWKTMKRVTDYMDYLNLMWEKYRKNIEVLYVIEKDFLQSNLAEKYEKAKGYKQNMTLFFQGSFEGKSDYVCYIPEKIPFSKVTCAQITDIELMDIYQARIGTFPFLSVTPLFIRRYFKNSRPDLELALTLRDKEDLFVAIMDIVNYPVARLNTKTLKEPSRLDVDSFLSFNSPSDYYNHNHLFKLLLKQKRFSCIVKFAKKKWFRDIWPTNVMESVLDIGQKKELMELLDWQNKRVYVDFHKRVIEAMVTINDF